MTGRILGLALVALSALPAQAADTQWRIIDSVVACYEMRAATTRCRAFGIVERTPDDRMLCIVNAGRSGADSSEWHAHISCQTTSWERMHDRGGETPGIDKLQLPSDPPQTIRRGEAQWRIEGSGITGCVGPLGERPVCAPKRDLP